MGEFDLDAFPGIENASSSPSMCVLHEKPGIAHAHCEWEETLTHTNTKSACVYHTGWDDARFFNGWFKLKGSPFLFHTEKWENYINNLVLYLACVSIDLYVHWWRADQALSLPWALVEWETRTSFEWRPNRFSPIWLGRHSLWPNVIEAGLFYFIF